MKEAVNPQQQDYLTLLRAARDALANGQPGDARRFCRNAIQLAPHLELPWIFLARLSSPRAGLAYLARALEINPKSKVARKAIRALVRSLPPRERRKAVRKISLPMEIALDLVPVEALTARRLLSPRVVLVALILVASAAVWYGGQPADALQPQIASADLLKATLTPTHTLTPTPTSTPTPTLTPTPTSTATPTLTPTTRPAFSYRYATDPDQLADEGRWIDVDLSAQRVTAFDGDTPVRSFIVSTGTSAHPTVTGQFRVYIKLRSTPMAGPGYYLPGVPYTMYFYKGYALHGTYWHDNFGTPMSHGCVNLRTSDAEWLYNFASVGTLVNVHP